MRDLPSRVVHKLGIKSDDELKLTGRQQEVLSALCDISMTVPEVAVVCGIDEYRKSAVSGLRNVLDALARKGLAECSRVNGVVYWARAR